MAAILMTHPRAVAHGRLGSAPDSRFVTDIAARTTRHMLYLEPLRPGKPMISGGDTLAALRIWKNEFR
jgi:hypothetical protein